MLFRQVSILLTVAVACGQTCIAQQIKVPAPVPFEYSRATTHVSGPLREDGMVDYVEAVNEQLAKGVTRDNNAAIGLLQAITQGATPVPRHYAVIRLKLGVSAPPPAAADPAGAQDLPQTLTANIDERTLEKPWTAREFPDAAKWLDSMKTRLDILVDASKRDRYFMPLVREREDDLMPSILLPHLNLSRQFALALKSRALLCLGEEDLEGFRRDAIAVVRWGRLLGAAPTMVEKLVAIGCESVGLDAIRTAATGGWLSEAQAAAILADLRAAPRPTPMYEAFDLVERAFMLEFLQYAAIHGHLKAELMLRQLLPPNANANRLSPVNIEAVVKDWNAALRSANAWCNRLADAGKRPTYAQRMEASEAIERDIAALVERHAGLKGAIAPLEERMMAMLLSSIGRTYQRETRIAATRTLTEATLALSGFRSTTSEYPAQLGELAPSYFKQEPIDPFTGKPLTYRRTDHGYLLQSTPPTPLREGLRELVVEVKL